MRTSMPGCSSWNAESRGSSHLSGQRRQRGHRQDMVRCPCAAAVGSEARSLTPTERLEDNPGFRCQRQCAFCRTKQGNPEFFLQPFDLMTDRGLRDVQLRRCLREAQMPGRRLEGAQSVSEAAWRPISQSPYT